MSWMNRQLPQQWHIPISSCAANAEQELMLGEATTNRIRIVAVSFTNKTAIVTDTDSGFRFDLMNAGTSGTLGRTVASFLANTAAATLAATQSIALTLSTATWTDSQTATRKNTEIEAGEVLVWKESTVGTGTARSDGVVNIESIIL